MTPQLYSIGQQVQKFFVKHHSVVFIAFISLFTAISIYVAYQVVQTVFEPTAPPTSTINGFDQKTIEKIKTLNDSNSGSVSIQLPSPRPNPFAE